MAQVVQKFVAKSLALMGTRNKSCNVKKFDRNRPSAVVASTIIRLTFVRQVMSLAGAIYLEISDGSLRVDCSKTGLLVSLNILLMNMSLCAKLPNIKRRRRRGRAVDSGVAVRKIALMCQPNPSIWSKGNETHQLLKTHRSSYLMSSTSRWKAILVAVD